MIRVTFYSEYKGFLVTGHAGFSESGTDIVCAAVSILATTCVNALETVAGIVPDIALKDGYLKAILPDGLTDLEAHDATIILRTFRQGICDLHEGHKEYITLRNGGNDYD